MEPALVRKIKFIIQNGRLFHRSGRGVTRAAQYAPQVHDHLVIDILADGRLEELTLRPTWTATLPSWSTVTVPTASSSDVTSCHSMLWLVGCSKMRRSVSRCRPLRCSGSGDVIPGA